MAALHQHATHPPLRFTPLTSQSLLPPSYFPTLLSPLLHQPGLQISDPLQLHVEPSGVVFEAEAAPVFFVEQAVGLIQLGLREYMNGSITAMLRACMGGS